MMRTLHVALILSFALKWTKLITKQSAAKEVGQDFFFFLLFTVCSHAAIQIGVIGADEPRAKYPWGKLTSHRNMSGWPRISITNSVRQNQPYRGRPPIWLSEYWLQFVQCHEHGFSFTQWQSKRGDGERKRNNKERQNVVVCLLTASSTTNRW